MTRSAIYEGEVQHVRLQPRRHAFRKRLFMMYLDLEELPELFRGRWLWSARRPNLVYFRRADYLGPRERPLRDAVLDRVEEKLARRPVGPVRVLTQLRTFGYVFNPVSFYFCHDEDDRLEAIVAEITNTPWGERHAYVMDATGQENAEAVHSSFDKDFHVSPFHGMEQLYAWSFTRPEDRLEVRMVNHEAGRPVFHVNFACSRRPITPRALAGVLMRYPLMTLRVHATIYWQAAKLFVRRIPFHTHPKKRKPVRQTSTP